MAQKQPKNMQKTPHAASRRILCSLVYIRGYGLFQAQQHSASGMVVFCSRFDYECALNFFGCYFQAMEQNSRYEFPQKPSDPANLQLNL